MEWIEETGWESWLGTGGLIGVAVVAVLLLLLMVMRFKVHAFLALIIVSLLTALAAGIPVGNVVETLVRLRQHTLGNVALLVAIGAMLGALVETSGGARALAEDDRRLRRAPRPLRPRRRLAVHRLPHLHGRRFRADDPDRLRRRARRLGMNLLAVELGGGRTVHHARVPAAAPGPVAATEFVEANLGYVLLLGLLVVFPIWWVSGHLWGKVVARRFFVDVPDAVFGEMTGEEEEIENPPGRGPWCSSCCSRSS